MKPNLLLLLCVMYSKIEWVRFGELSILPPAFVGTDNGGLDAS